MPRYFFHMESLEECLLDLVGTIARGREEVRLECLKAIREMQTDDDGLLPNGEGWCIIIVDEANEAIARISLSDMRPVAAAEWAPMRARPRFVN